MAQGDNLGYNPYNAGKQALNVIDCMNAEVQNAINIGSETAPFGDKPLRLYQNG